CKVDSQEDDESQSIIEDLKLKDSSESDIDSENENNDDAASENENDLEK
ncbi:MAG: hypothetical protein GX921_06315, partial [Bacteroidales bacterium]|nr:hypothetical protein [Bacteroidales bacterium]